MSNNNFSNGYSPMAPQQFYANLEGAVQQESLRHPEKTVEHRMALDRDAHKSFLRLNEYNMKQKMKNQYVRFRSVSNGIIAELLNGTNTLIFDQIVFRCEIKQIWRLKREGTDELLWQMILIDKKDESEIRSPLYSKEYLQSCCKLRKTILTAYYEVGDAKIGSSAWKWLQTKLMGMFEKAEIIVIPSKTGWFHNDEKWRFIASNCFNEIYLNEEIKKFSIDVFSELHIEDVMTDFLNMVDETVCAEYSALLILRLCSIFGRLTEDLPLELGIVFVGEKAREVAGATLRTMHNQEDVVNLDSDRVGKIQGQVELLQDTPIIFISSDPDSKSTQNRVQKVMSWLRSGYMEGIKVKIPFVFCLQRFSKYYPLDDMILFEADKISISAKTIEVFAKIQYHLVREIEKSGEYLVSKFREKYRTNLEEFRENKTISLVWAVVDTFLDIFKGKIDDDSHTKLSDLLYESGNDIYEQLMREGDTMIEIFREQINQLCDAGKLLIGCRNEVPVTVNDSLIFYDDEYYYFKKDTLEYICRQMELDYKTLLYIKQCFTEQNLVKLYRNNNHSRDLNIDFLAYNSDGQREKLSGLAIKREFWDTIGGVTLVERGNDGDAIEM